MTRLLSAVVLGSLFAGCAIPEDQASETLGAAWCHKERKCNRTDFDRLWASQSECASDMAAVLDDVAALYQLLSCDYDGGEARAALHDIRSASCETFGSSGSVSDPQIFVCGG